MDKRSQKRVLYQDIGNLISPFEDLCLLNDDSEGNNELVNDDISEKLEDFLQLIDVPDNDLDNDTSDVYSIIGNENESNGISLNSDTSHNKNNDPTNMNQGM